MPTMWNGAGHGHSGDESKEQEDDDAHNRLVASALAAYAGGNVNPNNAYSFDASYPGAQYAPQANPLLYQSTAVEAFRHQEAEMQLRQQHAMLLHQQQHAQATQYSRELQEFEYARQLQQQALQAQQYAEFNIADATGWDKPSAELANPEANGEGDKKRAAEPTKAPPPESDAKDMPPRREPMKVEEPENMVAPLVPRGKRESMAAAFAAARIRQELSEQREETVVTAIPVADDAVVEVQAQAEVAVPAPAPRVAPSKKKLVKRKRASPKPKPKKPAAAAVGPSLDDPVPPIRSVEYEQIIAVMEQFCRVPLLAEFSRPVALLHPKLFPTYSKIVSHPIDLGRVCRGIRRRKYQNTRDIQLDMWKIFANCIKYHTCPSNKDGSVPSFVSIALHLREYFNALWQEYMLPSDPPAAAPTTMGLTKSLKAAFSKREKDRKERIATSAATVLSSRCLEKTAAAFRLFLEMEGRADCLDKEPIFSINNMDETGDDMYEVVSNLQHLQNRLSMAAQDEDDYSVEELDRDARLCYTAADLFESKPSLRIRVGHRVDRLIGKIVVNIFEANSRGVNQSSVWGCIAAAVWARESSKKPYWPALVLGIMAPDDQSEEWHAALTERNERRLPEKLLTELQVGKRKAEQAIRRQNTGAAEQMSYFLVEFMGTHEFIWVKESDIIETFDPDIDPNRSIAAGNVTKKKRSSRSNDIFGSKTFMTAIEEGRWALEEFEAQLNDPCGDLVDDVEEEEEAGYSYAMLCQSDDEADGEGTAHDSDDEERTLSEVEEANELLLSEGLLDFTANGRKKRTAAVKKQKADTMKASRAKKPKQGKALAQTSVKSKEREKVKEEKREQRDLEKRRKKRARERERALKEETRKRSKTSPSEGKQGALADKRGRARAMVKAYVMQVAKAEDLKSLGLAGVMGVPATQLDSTGLLGMALAFRAAAGELNMSEGGDQGMNRTKPWEAVDVDGPRTTEERQQNLLKRKLLLEAEIERLKRATQLRKDLTEVSLQARRRMEEEVIEQDKAAREVLMKKPKKKVVKSPKTETSGDSRKKEIDETGAKDMGMESVLVVASEQLDFALASTESPLVGEHAKGKPSASAGTATDVVEEEQPFKSMTGTEPATIVTAELVEEKPDAVAEEK